MEFFRCGLSFNFAYQIAATSEVPLVSSRYVASEIQDARVLGFPSHFKNCGTLFANGLNSVVSTPPVNASSTAAITRDIWVIAFFKGLLSPSSSSNATRGFPFSLWFFAWGLGVVFQIQIQKPLVQRKRVLAKALLRVETWGNSSHLRKVLHFLLAPIG